ncbi:MAG: tetratricopeptide repeat protein [Coriobacteriia bacterium]
MLDAEPRQKVQRKVDPWVAPLIVAILLVLILVLTAVVYLVYTGVSANRMPRTLAEMQLKDYEQQFLATPGDPEAVARYARQLIEAKRYSRARSVIATFRSSEPTADASVIVEEARLANATGSPDEALAILDTAIDAAAAQRDTKQKELEAKGVYVRPDAPALVDAALLKSQILDAQGDTEGAIEVLTLALKEDATMADILVWRGDLEAKSGDTESARADYNAALKMIPDYAPALAGLKAIGAEGAND